MILPVSPSWMNIPVWGMDWCIQSLQWGWQTSCKILMWNLADESALEWHCLHSRAQPQCSGLWTSDLLEPTDGRLNEVHVDSSSRKAAFIQGLVLAIHFASQIRGGRSKLHFMNNISELMLLTAVMLEQTSQNGYTAWETATDKR